MTASFRKVALALVSVLSLINGSTLFGQMPLYQLSRHKSEVWSVAFSPDRVTLFTAGGNPQIYAWNTRTGKLVISFDGHQGEVHCLAVSNDGKFLASGGSDNSIKIWSTSTGNIVHSLDAHSADVHAVAFSPNGKWLASASSDYSIRIWDVKTGELLHSLYGHEENVTAVAFSPDGKRLASGSLDEHIIIWETNDWQPEHTFNEAHHYGVRGLQFVKQGHLLISGGWDGLLKVWRMPHKDFGNKHQHVKSIKAPAGHIMSVAASPDGKYVACGSSDHNIYVYHLPGLKLRKKIEAHSADILTVAFSNDGKNIASGGMDAIVKIWSAPDLETKKKKR